MCLLPPKGKYFFIDVTSGQQPSVTTFNNRDRVFFWRSIFAETGPQAGGALADGGRAAAVFVRAASGGRLRLHGADGQEEASVGGGLQPQRSGGGRSSAGDGQHAEGSAGGKTHLTGQHQEDKASL